MFNSSVDIPDNDCMEALTSSVEAAISLSTEDNSSLCLVTFSFSVFKFSRIEAIFFVELALLSASLRISLATTLNP